MVLKPQSSYPPSYTVTSTYRAWAEIDLGVIKSNLKALQSYFGTQTKIMAVVKANAYGLGAVPIAAAALEAGAKALAVSSFEEGVILRQAGLPGQILVLGYVPPEAAEAVVEANLTATINSPAFAFALSKAAFRMGSHCAPLPVQIKLDTGLHRFGLEQEEALQMARLIHSLPELHLQGLYTHFATADEAGSDFLQEQLRRYNHTKALLLSHGFRFEQEHLANSAAAIGTPEARHGMVRIGLSMLGYYPSAQAFKQGPKLKPCFTLKSRVARLSALGQNEGVGYNLTYIAPQDMRVALIPVGYADGYRRSLSNKGVVLINKKRADVLGKIMMDQFVVNVSDHTCLSEGDEVVVIGRQGEIEVTLEEVAEQCSTIPYEILTGLGSRIHRVYIDSPAGLK